jgi:flavin reductase (DIM6/NTAB) family NADH-FMN oxidoreductase RutF
VSTPDARQFRNTIGLFATGVAVIVAKAGQEILAMTANAVSSVSLDPMLVMFCPSKRSNLAKHLDHLSAFTINILRHDQQALSTFFAGGWKEPQPPPFRMVPCKHAPRLEGALASVECERWKIEEVGDHWMVLGQVVQLHTGVQPHQPLLFYSGRYRHVHPGGSTPAPDLSDVRDEPAHVYYE